MKQRWLPVAVLAGALFAINALARFIVWVMSHESDDAQIGIGLAAMAAVALLMVAAGYRWAIRYPMPRVIADLGAAVVAGALLSVLVGPFVGGSQPFAEGADFFFGQIAQYLALGAVGAAFGLLIAIALGRDQRSVALKRYAEAARARPRRVVRR